MNIVNVGYHSTNYYAVDIKGGKLLVDCGWPNTLPQFMAELKRKSVAASEIKYLLATHFHPDHAGLVQEFKDLGAKLILMESQTTALRSADSDNRPTNLAFVTVSAENNLILKFAESRAFLASLGLDGEIIPTPGHSDDSVCLILDNGFAFTGDLPPRLVITEDDVVTRASWDKIYQHNISQIFPAHGNLLTTWR
jgi:endoribonuclease LACTB2